MDCGFLLNYLYHISRLKVEKAANADEVKCCSMIETR